jgi:uncharacterized membrane protein
MSPMAEPAVARPRLDSIDLLRGAVMVLMLLDHTRDFGHVDAHRYDPLDPSHTTPLLYLTRWVTHLCAPVFVLLAGLGMGLRRTRGVSVAAQSRFLWTRGLWLVFLELTVVRVVAWFNVDLSMFAFLQVIWAIGISMIALAALVPLPTWAAGAMGAVIVGGHNALDALRLPGWYGPNSPVPGPLDKLWILLHQGGLFPLAGFPGPIVLALYPILPWFGLMAVGYASAGLYARPAERRRRLLRWLPVAMLGAFVLLRSTNLYGDPKPWTHQGDPIKTAMAFMDVAKYPPSLLYVLATLALPLFLLGQLDGRTLDRGAPGALVTFGRVPLFFYLLQWPTAHLFGILVTAVQGKGIGSYFLNPIQLWALPTPPDTGGPLWAVYLCWAAGTCLLYWPCRWFAGVKARRHDPWLRYL